MYSTIMKPQHIISIVLAVVILGALTWWASAYRTAPVSPTPTLTPAVNNLPTPSDMVGWKTYTNGQYRFEFQYPLDLELKTVLSSPEANGSSMYLSISSPSLGGPDAPFQYVAIKNISKNPLYKNVTSITEYRAIEEQRCAEINATLGRTNPDLRCSQEWLGSFVTIEGTMGYVMNQRTFEGNGHSVVFFENGILYSFDSLSSSPFGNEALADQIASTFRFTNP